MRIALSILILLCALSAIASIRIDATGEDVLYNATTLDNDWDKTNGVTIMAWVYVVAYSTDSVQGFASGLVTVRGAGTFYLNVNHKMAIYIGNSQNTTESSSTIPTGEWHHFALVRTANTTNWTGYVDGGVVTSGNPSVYNPDNPHLHFGNNTYGDWLNGRVAAGKVWTAALSQSEIQAETNSWNAVKTANIWSVVNMRTTSDVTDQSGNGNNFTTSGSVTTEADPNIGSPIPNNVWSGKFNLSGRFSN
jgi:hypothetical protein